MKSNGAEHPRAFEAQHTVLSSGFPAWDAICALEDTVLLRLVLSRPLPDYGSLMGREPRVGRHCHSQFSPDSQTMLGTSSRVEPYFLERRKS